MVDDNDFKVLNGGSFWVHNNIRNHSWRKCKGFLPSPWESSGVSGHVMRLVAWYSASESSADRLLQMLRGLVSVAETSHEDLHL